MSKVNDNKARKYKAIIEASERLMAQHGLQGLNMNTVAKEAKVAKGTLYLYFNSREEIIGTLALKARKIVLELFQTAVQEEEQAIEQLKALISAYYHFFKKNRLYYELVSFYEIYERTTETPQMRKVYDDITKVLVTIVEKGQSNGTIKPTIDPVSLAFSMWGMTIGIMKLIEAKSQLIHVEETTSEDTILQTYLQLFEDGIKT